MGRHVYRANPDFRTAFDAVDRVFEPLGGWSLQTALMRVDFRIHLHDGFAEGDAAFDFLRFSPRFPRHIVHFSSVADVLRNSQRSFWALELSGPAEASDP